MEAATGDKDFWVVDVVGNFCFVHPAKAGISSNLNLITDKGNIYSSPCRMCRQTPGAGPKGIVVPADRSSIVASTGPPRLSRPRNLNSRSRRSPLSVAHHQVVDEYKSAYPLRSNSTTRTRPTKRPSTSRQSITTTSSPTSRPMRRRSSACTRCATASPT